MAFLLSSSINDSDCQTVIKKDNTVLIFDPIKHRSCYASSHIGISSSSIICCHATECTGKNCCCLEVSMQLATSSGRGKECSAALASSLASIPGQFTIIKTSEDEVIMTTSTPQMKSSSLSSSHHQTQPQSYVYKHLATGKHFFYIKNWQVCYHEDSSRTNNQDVSKVGSDEIQIPTDLKVLGEQWLCGHDSASVTSAIMHSLNSCHTVSSFCGFSSKSTISSPSPAEARVSPANIEAFALEEENNQITSPMTLLADASVGRCPAKLNSDADLDLRSAENLDSIRVSVNMNERRGTHGISLLRAANIATLWYQSPARMAVVKVDSPGSLLTSSYNINKQQTAATTSCTTATAATITTSESIETPQQQQSVASSVNRKKKASGSTDQNLVDVKPPKGYISAFNYYVRHARAEVLAVHPQLEVRFHFCTFSCF